VNLGFSLIILIAIVGLATVNSVLHTRRAYHLRRENTRLRARLLMRDDDEEGLSPADAAARVMASLLDATGPVADAAAGVRRQREAEGWSPTAAEQMAHTIYMIGMARIAGVVMNSDGDDG